MNASQSAGNRQKARRTGVTPGVERLEERVALSGAPRVHVAQALGTISGQILDETSGRGLAHVKVQLINAAGGVVKTTTTGAGGRYSFRVDANGPYVVRELTPRKFVQLAPTFETAAPQGSFATNPLTGRPFGNANFNYRTGNNNPLNGPVGPASWSTIAPAGALPFQSPINLNVPPVDLSQFLSINYNNAVPKAVVNNGFQIQAQFPGSASDSLTLGGQVYNLAQFHFHDPSENQVYSYTYPMELHFVNTSASGAETVVAVFMQLGAPNPAFQTIIDAASASLTKPNTSTTIATPINFSQLLPSNPLGWFYEGSLTTPPLSQTVNWLVFATPITISFQQLQQYEAVAAGSGFLPNARPLQPTDGRQINQFNFDVNFQGQAISGLNFVLGPNTTTSSGGGASTVATTSAGTVKAQALPVVNAPNTLSALAASSQGLVPLPGCNCPLCQMLRSMTWHEVLPQSTPASVPSATSVASVTIPASAYLPD